MGNYKFKFSDMIPNAWFYKLRDMGRTRSHNNHGSSTHSKKKKMKNLSSSSSSSTNPGQTQTLSPHHRRSYHFARELVSSNGSCNFQTKLKVSDANCPDPPRRSSRQRGRRGACRNSPKFVTSSVSSSGCSCRPTIESVWTKPDSPTEVSYSPFDSSSETEFHETELGTESALPVEPMVSRSSSGDDGNSNPHVTEAFIDMDLKSLNSKAVDKNDEELDSLAELELPPIITKPGKSIGEKLTDAVGKEPRVRRVPAKSGEIKANGSHESKSMKEQRTSQLKKLGAHSPGVKLRVSSPRITSRKLSHVQGRKSVSAARRSLSESVVVVKSSFDPQKDFRESMVEMIVQNNIRASKDLEDLLACYLSLNGDEYHETIIMVFKQIWFDLTDNRVK